MFRAAICDNDFDDLNIMKGIMEKYFLARPEMKGQIQLFNDPRELAGCLDREQFEVFILDILMPEMSGIHLGREIRKANTEEAGRATWLQSKAAMP